MSNWEFIVPYLEHLSYAGIFITLAFLGSFIPLPEEVLLLVVGYIASLGYGEIWLVIAVSLIAGISGDLLLYFLSRRGNRLLSHFDRSNDKKRIARYENLMQNHGGKTIFSLRLIVGLRIFGPIVAGSTNVPWQKFAFYDLLALAVYFPTLILVGYHFHNSLQEVISDVGILSHLIFFAVVGLVGITISVYSRRLFHNK